MPNNRIPDRWTDYSKMGNVVEGTRLLPIKSPLKDSFTCSLSENDQFSPKLIMELAEQKGIKIGLVIDLTFTKKYYNPIDFKKCDIKYHKIFMPGHVIPEEKICDEFVSVVKDFETQNMQNDDIILVHCTHGLNRTGYMVCRYLITQKSISPKQAIVMFNEARGHKIERENYLNNLLSLKPSHCTVERNINPSTPSGFSNKISRRTYENIDSRPWRRPYSDGCNSQQQQYDRPQRLYQRSHHSAKHYNSHRQQSIWYDRPQHLYQHSSLPYVKKRNPQLAYGTNSYNQRNRSQPYTHHQAYRPDDWHGQNYTLNFGNSYRHPRD